MITRLFEVSVAVNDLRGAVKKYSDALGIKPVFMRHEDIPSPGLEIAIFAVGDVALSLIAPLDQNTPIARHIQAKGEGVYLIGIEVTDIEEHMRRLNELGIELVSTKPIPYVAGLQTFSRPKSMNGVQVCWSQHHANWDIVKSTSELWGQT